METVLKIQDLLRTGLLAHSVISHAGNHFCPLCPMQIWRELSAGYWYIEREHSVSYKTLRIVCKSEWWGFIIYKFWSIGKTSLTRPSSARLNAYNLSIWTFQLELECQINHRGFDSVWLTRQAKPDQWHRPSHWSGFQCTVMVCHSELYSCYSLTLMI